MAIDMVFGEVDKVSGKSNCNSKLFTIYAHLERFKTKKKTSVIKLSPL